MKKNDLFHKYFFPEKGNAKLKDGGPLGMGRFGFIAPELLQFVYALFTALLILFTWTNFPNPSELLWQRMTFISGTIALWVVYQLWPCRFIMMCRVGYLLLMLSSWYPDTFELNKQFSNLDHIFAQWDQSLFGFQPALEFSKQFASGIVSELMYFGYFSYYLFFVVMTFVILAMDYRQLERYTYILFGGFFACYVIFDLLPVAGPQYYFLEVGTEKIAAGELPDLGHYFADKDNPMHLSPGWVSGVFYQIIGLVHSAGERPTAAFPSSHIAIATVVMLVVVRMRMWKSFILLALPYLFLCLSTVYIMAHYFVDAVAGLVAGAVIFFAFGGMKLHKLSSKASR